jgi:hypothetical protein
MMGALNVWIPGLPYSPRVIGFALQHLPLTSKNILDLWRFADDTTSTIAVF